MQIEYKKADKNISKEFRGYQTMEAKNHPDVTKAAKANKMSDVRTFFDKINSFSLVIRLF